MTSTSDLAHSTVHTPHGTYRGRLAPSPTGHLHIGHARTFWMAHTRSQWRGGWLVLRIEDLDSGRSRPEFTTAAMEDLRWFGFRWQEGPDCGGPHSPYIQSERLALYQAAFQRLRDLGHVYPCRCSRKDIQLALRAPHADDDDEPIYPGTCRPISGLLISDDESRLTNHGSTTENLAPAGSVEWNPHSPLATRQSPTPNHPSSIVNHESNWRFRVPDGELISFVDGHYGLQQFVAGKDFGDFVVWRHDGLPAYQLAVVVDDAAMRITEVVRGADLLKSTARQLLLYRALGLTPPEFYHCPLMTDSAGQRLAKRHDALSLRTLRQQGQTPEILREKWKA